MGKITVLVRNQWDYKVVELMSSAMFPQLVLLPGAISEILVSVSDTGILTQADRYGLMAATLDESLDEEERRCVNRLLRSVLKGRVKVAEQISALA